MTSLPVSSTSLFRVLRQMCVPLLALAFGGACAAVPPAGSRPGLAEAQAPPAPQDSERIAAGQALAEAAQWRAKGDPPSQEKALARGEEALRLWRGLGDPAGQLAALDFVGQVQLSLGEAQKALASFEEELSLASRTGDRRSEASALKYLGTLQADRAGDPKQGLESQRRALAIWEELGDEAEQANVLYNIGYCLQLLGETGPALESYQRALALKQKTGDELTQAYILSGMAALHARRGEVQRALQDYDRALALGRKVGETGIQAATLDGMGRIYRNSGQLQKAVETYRQALELNRSLKDRSSEVKVLYSLGGIYRDLGETDEALKNYEDALALHQGNAIYEVRTLVEIARIRLAGSDPAAALEALGQALARSRELREEEEDIPPTQAAVHQLLGAAYLAQGDPRQAVASLNEALELRRKMGDYAAEAIVLLDLGTAEQALGDGAQAAADADRALELGRQTQAPFLQMTALFLRARLDRDRGDLLAARDRMEQALGLLESVRASVASDRLRSSFLASRQSYYSFAIDLLMRLDAQRPDEGFAAEALAVSERARARALLDLLAEGQVEKGISPELKSLETDLGYKLSQVQIQLIDALSRPQPDETKVAALRRELDDVESEREQLEWRIRNEHPRYAEVRYPSTLQLPAIQALLDDRTALLEYALGDEASYLFVVTKHGFESHRLAGAGRLRDWVRQLRTGLESSGTRTLGLYGQVAWRLYQELIAPAKRTLAGKRLLIAPDGFLHHVCFEALLTEPGGDRRYADLPYLVRRHAMAYVPSASVLAGLRTPRTTPGGPAAPKQLLAFGDPLPPEAAAAGRAITPGQTRGILDGRLDRLEGTGREIAGITGVYRPDEVEIYVQEAATEENVKHNPFLESARRIHFATHGFLDEKRPERSGLLLGRQNGSPEDGILQVYEVFNLSLHADLVVLSACETAGTEVTGEGLVGLTRAFLYAGTQAVVVSLWRVADVATPDLMVRFYRGLNQGEDPAEALRRSKLAMIKEGGVQARPYYWSPFILAGAPEPDRGNVTADLAPVK